MQVVLVLLVELEPLEREAVFKMGLSLNTSGLTTTSEGIGSFSEATNRSFRASLAEL